MKKKKKKRETTQRTCQHVPIQWVEFTKVATGQYLRRVIVDKVLHLLQPWCHISPTMATQLLRTARCVTTEMGVQIHFGYTYLLYG